MNLPQIEVAVTKYKQENQPKMVSQAEIKSILDEGYNQGNNDAEFIWLEYSELECPYCGTFANSNATDMVKQAYGDKVVHGFRHFPLSFHQKAIPAAIVAECA
jgi:protein-disulfide isomerase